MRTNFHTHTPRCLHAEGTEEDYVAQAVQSGYRVLGFADHSPWPGEYGRTSRIRMPPEALPGYVRAVRAAGRAYKGQIEVYAGLECEYFPEYEAWLRETVEAEGLDYLILGHHFNKAGNDALYFGALKDPKDAYLYVDQAVAGLASGLFRCFAHPDLYLKRLACRDEGMRDCARTLCRAAKQLGIPLEFNLLGLRKTAEATDEVGVGDGYPSPLFWETAAAEGCTAVIGVDAHSPAHLADPELHLLAGRYLDALGMARTDGLEGVGVR